ncbi:MAG: MBOAT family protein [Oscillospiraceae bacterium]|nr:MBOAT family protein [Oscillospiraceae bacterium]MBQ3049386.1 MBOAT family protein [Oscillospiraceae bacterium]MBQ9938114.1 MBOAT family protein [Oscillospiraceae bacterium]
MLFSGIPFLFYFLPAVIILYLIAPKCLKNTVLLVSSLVFYAWGEPRFVIIMVSSIALGYVFGLLIEKFRGRIAAKIFIALSVIMSIGILGYFKYADFMISNFNAITGLSVPLLRIALPIGISFYTFQLLSYTIDVYRGDVAAQRNPIDLAAYIALFPQLIAGPIVRYSDVAAQLKQRSHTLDRVALGIRRFIIGLAKKVLVANALGELCDVFRSSGDKSVLFFWLYAIAFALHIYFDFSGYSDMAIGLGKLFGFDFIENFNYPYISKSIAEFWRRWHISLGSWFRDYVYIPLGGNRVSKLRWFFNTLTVWMLTGLWHGASWNFVIWGLYFAFFLLIEKFFLSKLLDKIGTARHLYVLFFVLISFVIFNAADMNQAFADIGGMFGAGGIPLVSTEAVYYLKNYAVTFIVAIIGATPFPKKLMEKLQLKKGFSTVLSVAEPIVLAAFLIVIAAYLIDGSFNPFLYFRF